jgi:outer membrane autotransporter protein
MWQFQAPESFNKELRFMEHRQKTWGGWTLVSASLAVVLGAILFLGNGVAWGQPLNIGNTTDNSSINISDGKYITSNQTANSDVPPNINQGIILATGNVVISNSTIANVSNITAVDGNIVLDRGTSISINGSDDDNGTISAGKNITINGSKLTVEKDNATITAKEIKIINNSEIDQLEGLIKYINATEGGVTVDNSKINITGNITANTSVNILNNSNVNVSDITVKQGNLTVSESIVNASGNVTADNNDIIIELSEFNVTGDLNATKGQINITDSTVLADNLSAKTDVIVTGGTVTVNGNLTSGRSILVTGADIINVTSGDITAVKDINLSNSTVFAGNITAGGINVSSGVLTNVTGNISVTDNAVFDGGNIYADGIKAEKGEINISNIEYLSIGATGLSANKSITLNNVILINSTTATNFATNDSIIITNSTKEGDPTDAGINLSANKSVIITDSSLNITNITAKFGDINISGETKSDIKFDITGNVIADKGNINFLNLYDLKVEGNVTASNGSIVLSNLSIVGDTNLTAKKFITIDSTSGNITNIDSTALYVEILNSELNLAGNITSNGSGAVGTTEKVGIIIENTTIALSSAAVINSTKGDLIISSSTIDNLTTAPILETGKGYNLLIDGGDSKVTASKVINNNGTITIAGGENYLGIITGQNTNVTISNGVNNISSLTITDNKSRLFGTVSVSGGENSFGSINLVNTSLSLSGNVDTSNNFSGDIDIFNGNFINSAVNTTLEHNYVNVSGGSIEFISGDTLLNNVTINLTAATDKYIKLSGDAEVTISDTITFANAVNSGFTLTDESSLYSYGATTILDGNITVGPNSTLRVGGSGDLSVDEVTFEDSAIFAVDDHDSALISEVTVKGPVFVYLDFDGLKDLKYWDDTQIIVGNITNSNGELVDVTDSFRNPFFAFTNGTSGSEGLVVVEYRGTSGAIKEVAKDGGFKYTRNFASASNLIDRVIEAAVKELSKYPLDADVDTPLQHLAGSLLNDIIEADALALSGQSGSSQTLLRQLIGESTLGVKNAVVTSIFKANSVVLGRLDKIHTADLNTPPAAGEGTPNRAWIGGFGSWAKQDDTDDVSGYKYDTAGFALGYDMTVDGAPGLVFGVSTSFAFGEVKSNLNLGQIDTDTVSLGVYGSYKFDSGLFIDGTVGYGHSKNKSTVLDSGFVKKGSYDIDTWQFGVRGGWIFNTGSFEITPSLGVRYLHLEQDDWDETGASPKNHFFKGQNDRLVEIPLQVKISTTIDSGDVKITPELRLGYSYAAKTLENRADFGYVNYRAGGTEPVWGVKQDRSTFQIGGGLKFKVTDSLDIFANYDLDVSKDYRNHQASAGLGFEF